MDQPVICTFGSKLKFKPGPHDKMICMQTNMLYPIEEFRIVFNYKTRSADLKCVTDYAMYECKNCGRHFIERM